MRSSSNWRSNAVLDIASLGLLHIPVLRIAILEQLQETLYPSQLLEMEILIEKYPPRASLSGYPNIAIIYFRLLTS